MSLFGFFKSKKPSTVIANILDPNHDGVKIETWLIGEQISKDAYENLGSNGSVYISVNYIAGERKYLLLNKNIWEEMRKQYEAIELSSGSILDEYNALIKEHKL